MSTEDHKELRVAANENHKRIMYITKEMLLNRESVDLVAGTQGALVAMKAAETLARLNYITYSDIRTETLVINDRRRTRVLLTIKKTAQFQQLYDENEVNRKKFQEEKEIKN
jgi:hypothetical protein